MQTAKRPKSDKADCAPLDAHARLQAVLDSVADAIVVIDQTGTISQWNDGAERIFGYQAHEILGADIAILMPEPQRSGHKHYVDSFLLTGDKKIIGKGRELSAVRKDGSVFPIELTIKDGYDDGTVFFTGIVRDITERKRIEAELVTARKQAEEANLAKSQFLATMSHEIRTPMNGILGMANLLSMTHLNGRQGRLVENVMRSGQALLSIINDILDLSKIEAGRLDLFEVDFDLREVIAEVADLFGERCSSKGLEFVYFVAEDVPSHLRGDPARLRQILINLVGNAIKFTERGEILVEVTNTNGNDDNVTVGFTVEDTGIGIAPEQRARVFESFHQVDGSMTRSRGGSGLGLAITRQLVELMGGSIGVESELGRGSRFRFTARFNRSAQEHDAAHAARKITRPLSVLLVDTNAISAHVMSLYLSSWKIDLSPAATVDDAYTALKEVEANGQIFDAAIIDIKGLGPEGLELAAKIQALKQRQPTKLILLTGMDKSIADESIEEIGAFATLTKPVRPSELFNCLGAIASGASDYAIEPFFVRRNARTLKLKFNARILVVEDNTVNQEVALGMLETFGCKVVTAPNGRAAVQHFAEEKFDLILMDCEMPIMDGFEATRRIRDMEVLAAQLPAHQPRRKRIPIVALTAHALSDVRDRCSRAGMDDFLVKPFDGLLLAETLKRWLEPDTHVVAQKSAAKEIGSVAQISQPAVPGRASTTGALEMSAINEIRMMGGSAGPALVNRVITQFLSMAPALTAAIHEKIEAGDAEGAWRDAHSLKSSAGTLGARRLASCCNEIEMLAREIGVEPTKELLTSLDNELADVVRELQKLVEPAGG